MSELSGLSNLLYKYKGLNLDKTSPEGRKVLEQLKKMEHKATNLRQPKVPWSLCCARP
ncbi:hypothetical protein N752_10685 [Desulforamulus aquiferis]|nr:hypothetical protein [Desulforamulus aquiferis]RYD05253.1 hypothetical protein N752_10685 [Desulforamulus aquiferis]